MTMKRTNKQQREPIDVLEMLHDMGFSSGTLEVRSLPVFSDLNAPEMTMFWHEWQKIPTPRRLEIIKAMHLLAEDNIDVNFQAVFHACLDDADAEVRVVAIDGLWEDWETRTMHRLIQMLHDPSDNVRESVLIGLSRFAYFAELEELTEEDAETLYQALWRIASDTQQPIPVRRRAIESIGYYSGPAEVQEIIQQAFAHPDQRLRESALVAMGRSMQHTWLPTITQELQNEDAAIRYEAARALGEFSDEAREFAALLFPMVNDDDPQVVQAAIWALGELGGEPARKLLERLAAGDDTLKAQAASEALEELLLFAEDDDWM